MPHALFERNHNNAVGPDPLLIQMRFRCSCAANEVVTINVLTNLDESDDRFIWTMLRMRDDMRREIAQHLKTGESIGRPDSHLVA